MGKLLDAITNTLSTSGHNGSSQPTAMKKVVYRAILKNFCSKGTYIARRAATSNITAASAAHKERVMEFLIFIIVIRENYHDATFQEKRNALDVLGVKVRIRQVEKGISGLKGSGEKAIEITYSSQFPGVNTSLHAR